MTLSSFSVFFLATGPELVLECNLPSIRQTCPSHICYGRFLSTIGASLFVRHTVFPPISGQQIPLQFYLPLDVLSSISVCHTETTPDYIFLNSWCRQCFLKRFLLVFCSWLWFLFNIHIAAFISTFVMAFSSIDSIVSSLVLKQGNQCHSIRGVVMWQNHNNKIPLNGFLHF